MRTQPKALIAALVLSLAVPLSAWAATHDGAKGSTAAVAGLTDGEVRKVDAEEGKLTLRHGEIKDLDMPGMTMVFQVTDAALLDKVPAGDKVRFAAEKAGSAYVVTTLEVAP